jgi:hypothetical protein
MAVILVCLFLIVAMLTDQFILPHQRAKLSSKIIEAYRSSAISGLVAVPTTAPDALQTWSMCIYSPPLTVRVRTAGGSNYTYRAVGHPISDLKATSWTFRLISVRDEQGHVTFTPNDTGPAGLGLGR